MKYTTPPPTVTKHVVTSFKTFLTTITMCCLITVATKAQTTFTATTLKADTVKSTGMISANGITATDTVRAKDHVVIEQNLELQNDVSLLGRFDIGNGFAFKTYPANTNHPAVFRFGGTGIITPGPGFNPPLDPEDLSSCANAPIGSNPLYSFNGFLKSSSSIGGSNGSVIFGHDGANGLVDVQGLSSNTNSGGLLINYNCHRNVAICTGASPNPSENKVFIGDFLNARKHVEIGDATYPISDPSNTALDIRTNSGKGIKFTTNNNGLPLISVANINNVAYSPFTVFGEGNVEINTSNATKKMIVIKDPALAVNLQEKFVVHGDGKTYIGGVFATTTPYMLTVNGKIGAREIKVSIQNPWPDYVFAKNYKLQSLESLENYLSTNKHLPNIPSAQELKKEELGLDLAQMQGLQMEKIEEIYLHLIELNKQVKELQKENKELKQHLKK